MKKAFAMLLALMMILSLATTAMAAEEYSVTIKPSHDTGVEDHVYEAYQIFSGKIDSTGTKLVDVQWGNGVDSDMLLEELNKLPAWADKIVAASEEKSADGEMPAVTKTTAQQLADLLADKNTTSAMVDQFRTAAGICLDVVAATANSKNSEGNYFLDLNNTGAGYYLVKDKDDSLSGETDTYTNYMLRVVGKDELHPKSGTVTVNKDIIDAGTAKTAADYSIGDTVHFRVDGTLPKNYGDFTAFSYRFEDTMSDGLTFVENSVKIYLENSGTKSELVNRESEAPFFTVTHSGQSLKVEFADLKKITGRTIDASTVIYMEYDAILNTEAEIGEPGNPNKVKIVFDNNPYTEGEGETPEDTVWAFTWELDTTKTDDTGNSLANAQFVFYREKSGKPEYVILNQDNTVKEWTSEKEEATVLVSEQNEVMPIIGLEADTYYLEETAAPDGYNLLDAPVTIIITATPKGLNSSGEFEIDTLTVKYGNGEVTDGDTESGIVAGNVVNKSGAVLPETGGMGTTVLYVVGAAMVMFAVVMLVTKKRMNTEA